MVAVGLRVEVGFYAKIMGDFLFQRFGATGRSDRTR
jgi:hypothetical protein